MCDRSWKIFKGGGAYRGQGLIVDPIVHQAALNRCDLASAEIAYPKHEVTQPYLYTMIRITRVIG